MPGSWCPTAGRTSCPFTGPIEGRPDAANARTELGHLEGDLIIGAKNSQIAILVDRKSRYLTMVPLPSRHTATVIPAPQQAFTRMDVPAYAAP
ncbi:hypothetical protein GCM10009733_061630 [Nonomuraea maheshkhaliensis]|uniref:Uncharacterized protein n=1 Tax=Nonomuraea maheshkhaliensis TaxID=419590 RepID=A0ABN2FPI5_9ACTN